VTLAAACAAAIAACTRGPQPPDRQEPQKKGPAAAPGSAVSAAAPVPPDAGVDPAGNGGDSEAAGRAAVPAPLPLKTATAAIEGTDVPLSRDSSTLIDPGASFRVEIGVPLLDGRLALHDEQDAMVASSGTSEVGSAWTRYGLVPDEPLRPGTSYTLRVDGSNASEVHGLDGRAFSPLVLHLQTTGVAPPPARPAKRQRRR
jgi:hypothetical protein